MKIKVKRSKLGLWRVYIIGGNNEIMLVSETYYSKGNSVRAARKLAKELGIPARGIK